MNQNQAEENKTIVRRLYAAFSSGNAPGLAEVLAGTPAPDGSTPRQLACGAAEPPLLQILPGPSA